MRINLASGSEEQLYCNQSLKNIVLGILKWLFASPYGVRAVEISETKIKIEATWWFQKKPGTLEVTGTTEEIRRIAFACLTEAFTGYDYICSTGQYPELLQVYNEAKAMPDDIARLLKAAVIIDHDGCARYDGNGMKLLWGRDDLLEIVTAIRLQREFSEKEGRQVTIEEIFAPA